MATGADLVGDHEDSCTSSGFLQDITLRNIEETMESEDEYKRLIPDEKRARDGKELESNVEYRGGKGKSLKSVQNLTGFSFSFCFCFGLISLPGK